MIDPKKRDLYQRLSNSIINDLVPIINEKRKKMKDKKIVHLLYTPFTGLGLFNGYRGTRWLRNRIKIFKQFVIPSLKAQTNQNFVLWVSWRYEDKDNKSVLELKRYVESVGLKTVFTYTGVCFYDDKHSDDIARKRLIEAVHGSMGELLNVMGEADTILMTIQPSDDTYYSGMVEEVQKILRDNIDACGYSKGYICNYLTLETREYNPKTNPPFYTIKFPRDIFIDPLKHLEYTGIKYNHYNTKYKLGTPLPSHEYLKDVFGDRYKIIDKRGFLVGCHGTNISTNFNIPYAGENVNDVLKDFGLEDVPKLKIRIGLGKRILLKLPHKIQRKLRYWREKYV